MQANNIYGELVDGVVNAVVEQIRNKIIILIPPGSSRGEIVKRLVNLQEVEILVYKDLHEKLTKEVNVTNIKAIIKAIESSSEGFKVDDKDLVDYIKDNEKLSSVLESGNKIIVTKSTFEAILIYQKLYEELVNELKGEGKGEKEANEEAKDRLNNHIEIFFPPKHYEENLKQKDKALYEKSKDVISVNYDILERLGGELKGVSLKLLKNINNQWDYVKKGVEAIRALGPKRVSFADRIINIAKATVTALGATLGGLAVATVIPALLDSAPGLDSFKEKVSEFLSEFSSPFIKFFTKEAVSKFAEKTIEEIGKKGEPRNNTLGALMNLLKAVIIAKQYMDKQYMDDDDNRFETIIDEVASSWGLDVDTFKKFIENLYTIATKRIVTEQELEKLRTLSDEEFKKNLEKLFNEKWSKVRNDIENRLEGIENEIQKMRDEINNLKNMHGIYEQPEGLLFFNLEKKTFGIDKRDQYEFVASEKIEEYSHDLLEKIRRREFVVITGSKGVGKSVLTRYTLAKALKSESYVVYEVKKSEDLNDIGRVRELAFGRILIVLYDPVIPTYYEPSSIEAPTAPELKKEIDEIIKIIETLSSKYGGWKKDGEEIPIVIVLSTDILDIISKKEKSKEQHLQSENEWETYLRRIPFQKYSRIEIDLRQKDFLVEIVKAYSGGKCNEELYENIGEFIFNKYKGGYTLVARYAGDWLKNNNCSASVEEALKSGAGSAEAFIAQYIFENVFKRREGLIPGFVKDLAIPFIVRAVLGPLPLKWMEKVPIVTDNGVKYNVNLLKRREYSLSVEEFSFVMNWLSQPHEDIVEGVMKGIARGELSTRLKQQVEESESLIKNIKMIEGLLKNVQTQLEKLNISNEFRGEDLCVMIFFKSLVKNKNFRNIVSQHSEDFASAVGIAYTIFDVKIREENQLTDWITLGESIPYSVRKFFKSKATAFNDIVKPAKIIKSVFDRCKKEKRFDLKSVLSVIGAIAISNGKLDDCLEEASALLVLTFNYFIFELQVSSTLEILSLGMDIPIGRFLEHLVDRGYFEQACSIIYSMSLCYPMWGWLALEIIENKVDDISKLNWVVRLYYERTKFLVSSYQREIMEWIKEVEQSIKQESNYIAHLCMKAELGSLLSLSLLFFGEIDEALRWIKEAINAIEELEKLENLEIELKNLLNIEYIFNDFGEAAKEALKNLKAYVYGTAASVYLLFDIDEALKYAEVSYNLLRETIKLSSFLVYWPFVIPNLAYLSIYARALFLKGQVNDAIAEFRKNLVEFVKYGIDKFGGEMDVFRLSWWAEHGIYISRLAAEYIASNLAEGETEEMFNTVVKYLKEIFIWPLEVGVILERLLEIFGQHIAGIINISWENRIIIELLKFNSKDVHMLLKFTYLGVVAGPWGSLHRQWGHKYICEDLTLLEKSVSYKILEALENYKLDSLRDLLIKHDLIAKGLAEKVYDELDLWEITAGLLNGLNGFKEILFLLCRNKVELAKGLAESLQKLFEKKKITVAASLFGELADSLKGGSCNDNCRKVLLKLFYFFI